MPGVLAAGDVRHGSVKRVASAVGEGSIAVQLVHRLFAERPPAAGAGGRRGGDDDLSPRWLRHRMVAAMRSRSRSSTAATTTVVPLANAEVLDERLPTSRLVVIDAGHFVREEAPAEYASTVLDSIAGERRAPAPQPEVRPPAVRSVERVPQRSVDSG